MLCNGKLWNVQHVRDPRLTPRRCAPGEPVDVDEREQASKEQDSSYQKCQKSPDLRSRMSDLGHNQAHSKIAVAQTARTMVTRPLTMKGLDSELIYMTSSRPNDDYLGSERMLFEAE